MTFLGLRIATTIFLAISILFSFPKNNLVIEAEDNFGAFVGAMLYSLGWRALAIATVWVL